jgi:hypothetical protein
MRGSDYYKSYEGWLKTAIRRDILPLGTVVTPRGYASVFSNAFSNGLRSFIDDVKRDRASLKYLESAEHGVGCIHVASMLGILAGWGDIENIASVSLLYTKVSDPSLFNHMIAIVETGTTDPNSRVDFAPHSNCSPNTVLCHTIRSSATQFADNLTSRGFPVSEVVTIPRGDQRSAALCINYILKSFAMDWPLQ